YGSPKHVEIGNTVCAAYNALAIDRNRLDPELLQSLRDQWNAVGPVVTAPAEYAHALALAPADEAEAVVLDLVSPLRPGRHTVAVRRHAGLDEPRRSVRGKGRVPTHSCRNRYKLDTSTPTLDRVS